MRLKLPLIVGCPIQTTPFNKIPAEVIKIRRQSVSHGIINVVPIGNFGPVPGLVNPLAKLESTISVGATSVDGKKLLNFSSRGIPDEKYSGPSIVAPGENIIGKCHSGVIDFLLEKEKKLELITRENYYAQWGLETSEAEFKHIQENYVVGSGTSQAVELVAEIVGRLIGIRYINGMNSPPKRVREILIDMAKPMDGYENHEVGGGFVNFFVFLEYIENIYINGAVGKTKRLWEKPIKKLNIPNNLVKMIWMDESYNDEVDFTGEGLMSNKEI